MATLGTMSNPPEMNNKKFIAFYIKYFFYGNHRVSILFCRALCYKPTMDRKKIVSKNMHKKEEERKNGSDSGIQIVLVCEKEENITMRLLASGIEQLIFS